MAVAGDCRGWDTIESILNYYGVQLPEETFEVTIRMAAGEAMTVTIHQYTLNPEGNFRVNEDGDTERQVDRYALRRMEDDDVSSDD